LELGRCYELYFCLQAKKQVFISTRDCTTMFLKTVASSEYADIVTTLQSNVDSYRHLDDEYFLPHHFRVACKRVGHEAVNCDMLALALFIECHKQSLSDAERNNIESKWIARWKARLGHHARTPRQVMHTYCNEKNITADTLDLAMD